MADREIPVAHLPTDSRVGFDQLIAPVPDEPLPNIAKFDRLGQEPWATVLRAVEWIEPQTTCSVILKHHGAAALQRVLLGIARAASLKKVPMLPRVRSVAEFNGLKVY